MKMRVAAVAATMVFLGACGGDGGKASPGAATGTKVDTCPTLLQGPWKADDVDATTSSGHSGQDSDIGQHSDIDQVAQKDMQLTFDRAGKVAVTFNNELRRREMQDNWDTLSGIRCDTVEFRGGEFVVLYNAVAEIKGENKKHKHRVAGYLAACKAKKKKEMMLYILPDNPPPAAVGSIKLDLPSPLCSSGKASLQAIEVEILTHDGRVHLVEP